MRVASDYCFNLSCHFLITFYHSATSSIQTSYSAILLTYKYFQIDMHFVQDFSIRNPSQFAGKANCIGRNQCSPNVCQVRSYPVMPCERIVCASHLRLTDR